MAVVAIFAALAIASVDPAGSSGAPPVSGAAPRETATSQPAGDIPPPLQKITSCMIDAARAAPGVLAAERGVSFQDGTALVYVRYEYRMDDGRIGVALYSRGRDAPLESPAGWHTRDGKPLVVFATLLPGVYPMCDRDRHGRRDCANVRAWERSQPQPIPGVGVEAVNAAWVQTCGAAAFAMTA